MKDVTDSPVARVPDAIQNGFDLLIYRNRGILDLLIEHGHEQIGISVDIDMLNDALEVHGLQITGSRDKHG